MKTILFQDTAYEAGFGASAGRALFETVSLRARNQPGGREKQLMCNRYRMSAKQVEVARRFGIDPALIMPEPERLPPPELFPRRHGWVVRKDGDRRILDTMSWGFPPPANARAPVTNVRNLASPFWRSALSRPDRRCLVPVTEFCEWSGEKGAKTEHWFSLTGDEVFAFAGVWRPTEAGPAFAFLTYEPNPLVAPIHPIAMPVIVADEDHDRWLDGEVGDTCSLAAPFPSQLMQVRALGPRAAVDQARTS